MMVWLLGVNRKSRRGCSKVEATPADKDKIEKNVCACVKSDDRVANYYVNNANRQSLQRSSTDTGFVLCEFNSKVLARSPCYTSDCPPSSARTIVLGNCFNFLSSCEDCLGYGRMLCSRGETAPYSELSSASVIS